SRSRASPLKARARGRRCSSRAPAWQRPTSYRKRRDRKGPRTGRRMRKMYRLRNSIITALLLCSVLFSPTLGRTEEKAAPKSPLANIGDFTYTSQDRRDPFEQVHV